MGAGGICGMDPEGFAADVVRSGEDGMYCLLETGAGAVCAVCS